jgi:DNA replicative helicase MCM subunit Mcm2 (Cdc46/Mcm family)
MYAEVRRLSDQSGGIPIAVRHIESIIRISEAHAKAHLRNMVTDEDMRFGIRMLLESFICSQKHAGMLRSQALCCAFHNRFHVAKRDLPPWRPIPSTFLNPISV